MTLSNFNSRFSFIGFAVLQIVFQVDVRSQETPSQKPASENSIERRMVRIPSGCFSMGTSFESADAGPEHKVCINEFLLDITEVTQSAYSRYLAAKEIRPNEVTCAKCAAEGITWKNAFEYCQWLDKRLPTEAEWEYACRAGSSSKFFWGDSINRGYAWHGENNPIGLVEVARKKANPWGLYDMHGGVYEWTSDFYEPRYYHRSPVENPSGPEKGTLRVLRGGSRTSNVEQTTAYSRNAANPVLNLMKFLDVGFRCADDFNTLGEAK